MATRLNLLPAALAAAALATAIPAAAADAKSAAKPAAKPGNDCFIAGSWDGWTAPGDGDVLYLGVNLHEVYRVELTAGTHVHKDPDRVLINQVRGSNWICTAIDLDLTLSDRHGFRQPLIARSLRKLTPAEVAAIPRKDLPW